MSPSTRKTIVLLGVLALLAGLAVVGKRPWSDRRDGPDATPVRPLLDGNAPGIDRIEIGRRDGPVVLTRKKDLWEVSGGTVRPWLARYEQVARVTEWLDDLTDGRVVSRNPSRRGEYRVDDSGGLALTLSAGGRPVGRLVIGDTGPDLFDTYVRRADGNEVVLADGAIRALLDRPAASWRDLTLFPAKLADVTRIDLSWPGGATRLTRKDNAWKAQPPLPAEQSPEALAARIMALTASGLADTALPVAAGADLLTVTVTTTAAPASARILPGTDPDGRYRAISPGHDWAFLIPAVSVEGLLAILRPAGRPAP